MLTEEQKKDVLAKFKTSTPITDEAELDFIVEHCGENARKLQTRIDDQWLADMRRAAENNEEAWTSLEQAVSNLYTYEDYAVREEAWLEVSRLIQVLKARYVD